MLLTEFSFLYQIYLIFLHFDLSKCFLTSSSYSSVLFMIEIIFLFLFEQQDKTTYFFLGVSYLSCLTTHLAIGVYKRRVFTISSSLFMTFLALFENKVISCFILGSSLLFSMPRKPIPSAPQALTAQNIKAIIYLVIAFSVNLYCLYFGISHNALSLSSDAMMSICNNISILGSIIADIASRMTPSKKFSFGLSRAPILCDLFASLLLLIAAIDVFTSSIKSILTPNSGIDEQTNSGFLMVLSLISLLINVIGALVLGSIHIDHGKWVISEGGTTLSILCDMLSSFAVVLSSFLVAVFDIGFIDPFVSVFIGVILIIVSVSSISSSTHVLMQSNNTKLSFEEIQTHFGSYCKGHIWTMNGRENVLTCQLDVSPTNEIGSVFSHINKISEEENIVNISTEIHK